MTLNYLLIFYITVILKRHSRIFQIYDGSQYYGFRIAHDHGWQVAGELSQYIKFTEYTCNDPAPVSQVHLSWLHQGFKNTRDVRGRFVRLVHH